MNEHDIKIAEAVRDTFDKHFVGEDECYAFVAALFSIANVDVVKDCYERWLVS